MASKHPQYFPDAQQRGTFLLEKNVRMGPDGVFVADRKVSELGQIIQNIARTDVAEVKTVPIRPWRPSRDWRISGGMITGLLAGSMIGGVIGTGRCKPQTDCYAGLDGAFYGGMAGVLIGGLLGQPEASHHAADHELDNVIYRAP